MARLQGVGLSSLATHHYSTIEARSTILTFPSFDAEIFRCAQEMCVIGVNDAELRFCCRGQVNGVGCPEKHSRRQLLIDVPDSQENFAILRKPPEGSRFDMCPHLAHLRRHYAEARIAPSRSLRWKGNDLPGLNYRSGASSGITIPISQ